MPTYDYECDACGKRLEMFQRMSDEPVKTCPACGQEKLRRLFGTGAAIVFKGSGFYQTDYRSESYKSGAKKETKDDAAKSDSKSSKDGAGKSDSKTSGDAAAPTPSSESPKPASKPEKSSD